jgi:hypothetical protein
MNDNIIWSPASDPPQASELEALAELWIKLGRDIAESTIIIRAWNEKEKGCPSTGLISSPLDTSTMLPPAPM